MPHSQYLTLKGPSIYGVNQNMILHWQHNIVMSPCFPHNFYDKVRKGRHRYCPGVTGRRLYKRLTGATLPAADRAASEGDLGFLQSGLGGLAVYGVCHPGLGLIFLLGDIRRIGCVENLKAAFSPGTSHHFSTVAFEQLWALVCPAQPFSGLLSGRAVYDTLPLSSAPALTLFVAILLQGVEEPASSVKLITSSGEQSETIACKVSLGSLSGQTEQAGSFVTSFY